ncbi:mannosyltransferase [Clonorchis sinensis]|uniref:Mannosyltransferase n=1 Tax=Clonorchis sinensis TaxID=79923 RepID=A0A8T1MUX1_CLOSI|nr:mannosyltransferase [Clonorchis sinensis]
MAGKRTVHVFVLGDLTRSPRIATHARYLADEGWSVTISGFSPSGDLSMAKRPLRVLPIQPCPDFRRFLYPPMLALILKLLVTSVILLWHLLRHCRSKVLLLQNPPAVPTFLLLWLFCQLSGKKLVVDWHNYGYTLLELSTGRKGLSSRLYRWLELDFAGHFLKAGDVATSHFAHLCVSRALQEHLKANGILASVVYDRPPDEFKPTSSDSAHRLLSRLSSEYPQLGDPEGSLRRTRLTEITALPATRGGSTPQWRPDRPAFVVSSCSWTPDDDFNLVVDALDCYDKSAAIPHSFLPNILFAVTGRGPLRDHFAQLIESKQWSHVEVIMPWLEWADYPVLLGCADLGISVHRSSSNLDLPMKIVDLFGVGVPVLALAYPALVELMPEDQFGGMFTNSSDLAEQLIDLLHTRPKSATIGSPHLLTYRNNLKEVMTTTPRGHAYWRDVALPIFENMIRPE